MSENVMIAIVAAGAALLASVITALASLSVVALQDRQRAKAKEEDEFFAAAQVVLTKGFTMIDRCRLWSGLLQGHSGVNGELSVLMRLRPAPDAVRVLDPLIKDQEEINLAGARVALQGDQDTVALCNAVLRAAGKLSSAVLPATSRGLAGRLRTAVYGRQGPDPVRVGEASQQLDQARRAFADHLRNQHGREPIDVFAVTGA